MSDEQATIDVEVRASRWCAQCGQRFAALPGERHCASCRERLSAAPVAASADWRCEHCGEGGEALPVVRAMFLSPYRAKSRA